MKAQVERIQVRSPTRVAYVFVAPTVLLLGVYLCVFLGLNSRDGSALLSRVLSGAVSGSLEFEALRVAPDLLSVTLYDARVTDLRGRAAIETQRLSCRFAPSGLIRNRITFDACDGESGRVLAYEYDDGAVGLVQAFEGEFRPKRQGRVPPVIVFQEVNLVDVDVLIAMRDMMLRFDSVDLTNGFVEVGRVDLEIRADALSPSGRILVSDRLVGLGGGKTSWDMAHFDVLRRSSPWRAAAGPTPAPDPGRRGWLDLPLGQVVIDRMTWRNDDIRVQRLMIDGAEVAFDGAGVLRMLPERPKLAPTERSVLAYEGWGVLTVPPTSAALSWVLPGLFGDGVTGSRWAGIDPLRFTGYGSVRFFEGETRLRARDLRVLDWNLGAIDAGLRWEDGVMSLSRDASADIFGGVVTGGGWFDSATGRWALDLCADGLDLRRAGAPYVTDPSRAALLGPTLATTPSSCAGEGWSGPEGAMPAVGLRLSGDLTLKALEVDPAADTPADKEIQPPMIEGTASELLLEWAKPPAGLPLRQLRASVGARLSQRGVVTFTRPGAPGLVLRTATDTLTVTGALDTTHGILAPTELSLRSRDFGPWLAALGGPDPGGLVVDVSLDAEGPLAAPDLDAIRLHAAHDVAGDGIPAFVADAQLDVDGDTLRVVSLDVTSPVGAASGSGSVALFDGTVFAARPDAGLDLQVDIEGLDLGRAIPSLGVDAALATRLAISGSAAHPHVAGAGLELIDFRVFGEPVDYLFVERFVLSDALIDASGILVIKGKGSMWGDVALDLAQDVVEVTAHGRRFRLGEVRTVSASGLRLAGNTEFDVRVDGPLSGPSVRGRVTIDDLRAEGTSIGAIAATFHTFDGAVEVAAQVSTDLEIAARIPLDAGPWELVARFVDAPIEAHVPALDAAVERSSFSGQVDVRLDPFGTGDARGRLVLDAATMWMGDRRFDAAPGAVAEWEVARSETGGATQAVTVDGLSVATGGRQLDVSGALRLGRGEDEIEARIAGESDFSLLRFFPELIVDAEGLARVDLTVAGPLDAPEIEGTLDFDRARIAPRGLGTSVAFGPGRLVVAGGRIQVPESAPLTGVLFGGDFTAWGDIGLRGLTPDWVDYRMFVTNLAYRVPDVANVTLTSENLRFQAPALSDPTGWLVTGDVQLVDARYYDEIEVVGSSVSFGGFGRTLDRFALPVWMSVPTLGAIQTDLTIQGRDRFLVQNTIGNAELDMEFRTDLQLSGRLGAMELVGEMEALESGAVTYRGRTFEVQSATLTFRGVRDEFGYPMPTLVAEMTAGITPCSARATSSLDLATDTGLAETAQVFITAQVEGQLPYDLEFQLESTPFYDQRDQLSLILTGCTVDALTGAGGGGQTLELVLAPVIDALERNVEERLSVDEVNLLPSTQGSAGISIQDEVSSRLRWGVDAEVGADDANTRQVARVEYRLFDWLLVEVDEQTARSESVTVDAGFRFRVKLD